MGKFKDFKGRPRQMKTATDAGGPYKDKVLRNHKLRTLNRTFLKLDKRAIELLVELFQFVNNIKLTPDLALRGGVYRELAHADIMTQSFDGWEVGYKLEDFDLFQRRKVFIKCEQPLREIPEKEKDPILAAVFDVFLERGQGMPEIEQISEFALLLTQDVIPMVLTQRAPRLVSKGPLH